MSINIPNGFLFSAVEAAIKKSGRKDLALIFSLTPCAMSGMFTTNKIKAAPVKFCLKQIKSNTGQAIVANSGNANACTGKQGLDDAILITRLVSNYLNIPFNRVYICSTGVIGTPMPIEKIKAKLQGLVLNIGKSDISDVAKAIMTTDTFEKIVSRKIKIDGKTITITGISKGAGMICPKMATMLAFIITDANIDKYALNKALKEAVKNSFNKITIDGDMSTNDTVLIMANGLAKNNLIKENTDEFKRFQFTLCEIAYKLSKMIILDAEGSTKVVEIEIKNAKNDKEAEKGAFAVANSLLVKTAIYGNDANWGRIVAVLGRANIQIKEEKIDIFFNNVKVAQNSILTGKDKEANEVLKNKEIKILVNLHIGKGCCKVLTSDLTEDYVKINAEYRT